MKYDLLDWLAMIVIYIVAFAAGYLALEAANRWLPSLLT